MRLEIPDARRQSGQTRSSTFEDWDAVELAARIRRRELSPKEAVEAAIAAIDEKDPVLNAVVLRDDEAALAAANGVDPDAPLAGVPFLVKDVGVDVAGFPTTYSCRAFDGAPADRDSPLVTRWRAAGLVILGKTNTPEFAADFVTEPEWRGATRNPWNTDRTPGGSSGGSAAAVAAGMVPLAHGTDFGGSIRVPAACCGLVGFKPSRGLVPAGLNLLDPIFGLSCDHVLAKSVRDSALMLDLTSGPATGDPAPRLLPEMGFIRRIDEAPDRLRIAVIAEAPGGAWPSAEIAERMEEVAQLFRSMGHLVSDQRLPDGCDPFSCAEVFWSSEAAALAEEKCGVDLTPDAASFGSLGAAVVRRGQRYSATDVVRARVEAWRVQRSLAQSFCDFDAVMTPTLAEPPVPIGEIGRLPETKGMVEWAERAYRFAPYTELFNVTGQPAVSVPAGFDSMGLPIGVQLAGRIGEDLRVLQLARALERELS